MNKIKFYGMLFIKQYPAQNRTYIVALALTQLGFDDNKTMVDIYNENIHNATWHAVNNLMNSTKLWPTVAHHIDDDIPCDMVWHTHGVDNALWKDLAHTWPCLKKAKFKAMTAKWVNSLTSSCDRSIAKIQPALEEQSVASSVVAEQPAKKARKPRAKKA